MRIAKTFLLAAALASPLFHPPLAAAQDTMPLDPACGNLNENTFRKPIDYHTADPELIKRVEEPHFPPHVEFLLRGNTDDSLGGDIAYTLRTFPNHPRALMSMSNLARKEKTDKPRKSPYSIHCWFQRAIAFRPEDGMVRMVYGIDLMKRQKYKEAIAQLTKAEELLGVNGNLFYNIGLGYFEVGDYEEALRYAHKSSAAGFSLPGLKKKLQAKNRWREPAPKSDQANDSTEAAPRPEPLEGVVPK